MLDKQETQDVKEAESSKRSLCIDNVGLSQPLGVPYCVKRNVGNGVVGYYLFHFPNRTVAIPMQ